MTKPARERYKRLTGLIFEYGERFPKRHGNWIRLRLTDAVWLTMDSWNKSVHLTHDAEYDNAVTGFRGQSVEYLGIDFGSYEPRVSATRLESIIRATEAALNARNLQ